MNREGKGERMDEQIKYDLAVIATHHGLKNQENQLTEEIGELLVAINKNRRYRTLETLKNIAEEIADVEIMLVQVKYLYGIFSEVESVKAKKIERELKRIEK